MSTDVNDVLRTMMREEIQAALQPLISSFSALSLNGLAVPARRKPGRPAKVATIRQAIRAGRGDACGVIGCKNPMRSKGYCSAHYQKFHGMPKKPASLQAQMKADGWTENPSPQSVTDTKLPRGRAGALLKSKGAKITRNRKPKTKAETKEAASA